MAVASVERTKPAQVVDYAADFADRCVLAAQVLHLFPYLALTPPDLLGVPPRMRCDLAGCRIFVHKVIVVRQRGHVPKDGLCLAYRLPYLPPAVIPLPLFLLAAFQERGGGVRERGGACHYRKPPVPLYVAVEHMIQHEGGRNRGRRHDWKRVQPLQDPSGPLPPRAPAAISGTTY